MLLFTTLILFWVQAVSKAEPPHNHYQHTNHGRTKSGLDWQPFQTATPENFNLLPEHPPTQQTPQYSSPWLPIGSSSGHNSGYRSEAHRFTDFQASYPFRHTPPVQHNAPPIHTPPPVQHTPASGLIPTQTFNRPSTPPAYDSSFQKHNPFGGIQLETPRPQLPGYNQYQSDNNHVQHFPSSYDVPLYAPMYEPGPNEDNSEVIDWASFASAFGYPPLSAPQPQRQPHNRYKIVFIKTPRIPVFNPPTTPPAPPDQEKTLIYVLINRPDYDSATTAAPPPSTTPSKPEVYFIQYKTKSNQSQSGSTIQTGNGGGERGLYEGQDMNQRRYGPTLSKPLDGNSL